MAEAGDWILVCFLSDEPTGTQFVKKRDTWPLHITFVPWFDPAGTGAKDVIRDFASRARPFEASFGDEEQFGHETRVTLVVERSELRELQVELLAALEQKHVRPRDVRYLRNDYRPHVTHHKNARIPANGEKLWIDRISLVRLLPDNICEIEEQYTFGAEYEAAA